MGGTSIGILSGGINVGGFAFGGEATADGVGDVNGNNNSTSGNGIATSIAGGAGGGPAIGIATLGSTFGGFAFGGNADSTATGNATGNGNSGSGNGVSTSVAQGALGGAGVSILSLGSGIGGFAIGGNGTSSADGNVIGDNNSTTGNAAALGVGGLAFGGTGVSFLSAGSGIGGFAIGNNGDATATATATGNNNTTSGNAVAAGVAIGALGGAGVSVLSTGSGIGGFGIGGAGTGTANVNLAGDGNTATGNSLGVGVSGAGVGGNGVAILTATNAFGGFGIGGNGTGSGPTTVSGDNNNLSGNDAGIAIGKQQSTVRADPAAEDDEPHIRDRGNRRDVQRDPPRLLLDDLQGERVACAGRSEHRPRVERRHQRRSRPVAVDELFGQRGDCGRRRVEVVLQADPHEIDLPGGTSMPPMKLAAQHDPGTEPRSDRDEGEVVDATRDAAPALPERRKIDVVLERHRTADRVAELANERRAFDLRDVRRQRDRLAVGLDHTRNAHDHAVDDPLRQTGRSTSELRRARIDATTDAASSGRSSSTSRRARVRPARSQIAPRRNRAPRSIPTTTAASGTGSK